MTASEAHVRIVAQLRAALSHALRGRAGVFGEIFLRVDGRQQVSADVFAVPGVTPGNRSVYAVPAEPVPSVTVEVLSPANRTPEGRAELEAKRSLYARIGVPLHIEVDSDEGFVAVWELRDGALTRPALCTTYASDAIGGVRLEKDFAPLVADPPRGDHHGVILATPPELPEAQGRVRGCAGHCLRDFLDAHRGGEPRSLVHWLQPSPGGRPVAPAVSRAG